MLTELHIEDFAIIDNLDLQFGPGLVIFTGETGAGKSIIIDAVETILGGRADSTFVRSGSERAIIEAVFHIPQAASSEILAILEREDLLDDPAYLSMGREIRVSGRNVARINGRSVNASLLREIGEYLIDLHGQSEHLSLLRVNQHLRLLDSYALSVSEKPANASKKTVPVNISSGNITASPHSLPELLNDQCNPFTHDHGVVPELFCDALLKALAALRQHAQNFDSGR